MARIKLAIARTNALSLRMPYHGGTMGRSSKEFQAFDATMKRLLTVPKAVVAERVAAHRERATQNPRKRGPKPKSAPKFAVRDPGDD